MWYWGVRKEASVGGWESGEMSGFKDFCLGGRQGCPWTRGRDVAEDGKIDVTISPSCYSQGWQPALPAEFGVPSSVVIVSEPDARVVVASSPSRLLLSKLP